METEHPLRLYRRDHELTLEDLARLVSSTSATISRIEVGDLQARHDLLIKLSDVTGISIDRLVRAGAEKAASGGNISRDRFCCAAR